MLLVLEYSSRTIVSLLKMICNLCKPSNQVSWGTSTNPLCWCWFSKALWSREDTLCNPQILVISRPILSIFMGGHWSFCNLVLSFQVCIVLWRMAIFSRLLSELLLRDASLTKLYILGFDGLKPSHILSPFRNIKWITFHASRAFTINTFITMRSVYEFSCISEYVCVSLITALIRLPH